MWKAMVAVVAVCSTAAPASASDFNHVRSDQAEIRASLRAGYQQSATFKALLDELESLPGIVYILETPFTNGLDGALLHKVAGPRDMPVLRVLIKTNLGSAYRIGILAHELQHVREVLRAGAATTPESITRLFKSLSEPGSSSAPHFETTAARELAAVVIKELSEQQRARR
jgi:hypothetical protein